MRTTEPPVPEFDQIVKGNVSIKKLSKHKYTITFRKIGKFLKYQVWDKDNVNNINDKRIVRYVSAKEWVNVFNNTNQALKKITKPFFTPTTIMETEDNRNFVFVIDEAYINYCGRVVFIVSTREISFKNNTYKKLTQLPVGKCNNVRFDIDDGIFFYEIDRDFNNNGVQISIPASVITFDKEKVKYISIGLTNDKSNPQNDLYAKFDSKYLSTTQDHKSYDGGDVHGYQLTCIDDDDVCITTLDTLLEDHTYTSFDSDTFREYLVRFDLILYDENNEELFKYLLNPKT